MQIKDCYFLGTITKRFGYKGEVIIALDTDNPDYYKNLESVLVEDNGLLVPIFLSNSRLQKGTQLRTTPENEELVDKLIGQKAYLPLSELPPLEGTKFYYHEIIGYTVINDGKELGKIIEVQEGSAQDLLKVQSNNLDTKEILIPIVEEWLIEVNHIKKTIEVELPDGFLSVFN